MCMRDLTVVAIMGLFFAPDLAGAANDPAGDLLHRLAPHLAVYNVRLHNAQSTARVAQIRGRIVYEMRAEGCTGFASKFRMVLKNQDKSGEVFTTDYQQSSQEDYAGKRYQFLTRYFVNHRKQRETKGLALTRADNKVVEMELPKKQTLELDRNVLFPLQHTLHVLAAARQGERFRRDILYDGGEEGIATFKVSTLIGNPRIAKAANPLPPAIAGKRHWPVQHGYFHVKPPSVGERSGRKGEQTPFFSMWFDLYENGVVGKVIYDYGVYQLRATLSELKMAKAAPCQATTREKAASGAEDFSPIR